MALFLETLGTSFGQGAITLPDEFSEDESLQQVNSNQYGFRSGGYQKNNKRTPSQL